MHVIIRIDYRTAEGHYRSIDKVIPPEQSLLTSGHVGSWVLQNLPDGATLIRVCQGWSPLAPSEVVIERIRKMATPSASDDHTLPTSPFPPL